MKVRDLWPVSAGSSGVGQSGGAKTATGPDVTTLVPEPRLLRRLLRSVLGFLKIALPVHDFTHYGPRVVTLGPKKTRHARVVTLGPKKTRHAPVG